MCTFSLDIVYLLEILESENSVSPLYLVYNIEIVKDFSYIIDKEQYYIILRKSLNFFTESNLVLLKKLSYVSNFGSIIICKLLKLYFVRV